MNIELTHREHAILIAALATHKDKLHTLYTLQKNAVERSARHSAESTAMDLGEVNILFDRLAQLS